MQIEWWHWAIAGIALVATELAVPAFVLIWFGLGALLVALVLAVFPGMEMTAQLSVWLIASMILIVLWFKVFRAGHLKTRMGASNPDVIGEIGLLVHAVAPFEKGQVRFQKPILGGEVWSCIADEAIAAGERVKVVAVEGSLLKVGRN